MADAFNPDKVTLTWTLPWEEEWVTAVTFLGSNRVAAGNNLGRILVWDLPEKPGGTPPNPVRRLDGHTNAITKLVATPDGREVWSTDINNRAVHVFDVAVAATEPREIAKLPTGNTPTWLTITPDGKTVYVANAGDDTVSVYDVAAKKQRATIEMPKGSAPKRCLVVDVPERAAETPGR